MERTEAIKKINELVGQDLRLLANKYGITVFKNDKKNKGWAGHVVERCLGLPLNSAQSGDVNFLVETKSAPWP